MKLSFQIAVFICFLASLLSCSLSKQIQQQANNILQQDTVLKTGQYGISIYEPASNSYWYNYNADKYFVPASNTKLFSMYAGMKYLGDSLVAARVEKSSDNNLYILPSGDPTFLHNEFNNQPLVNYLNSLPNNCHVYVANNFWNANALGSGWAWDDYTAPYMAERSMMPLYGNLITFKFIGDTLTSMPYTLMDILISADFTTDEWGKFENRTKKKLPANFTIERLLGTNQYEFKKATEKFEEAELAMKIDDDLIKNLLAAKFSTLNFQTGKILSPINKTHYQQIHSQPTDSLLKPMMHNSDNFFAEQTLLMASNEHLGYMSDEAMIDTLLKSDLKDIPQKPTWVDGSGLSRYNLFTPQAFVYLLNKMKNEFGLERLKNILPTGGIGTLKNYYLSDSAFIYAKTGTLSGTIALSGFLITHKNKLLIFSILTNNFKGRATSVRRAVEKFIQGIRKKY